MKNKIENMQYVKRTNKYKGSNVDFNLNTCRAFSYGHWCFVAKIKGKIIFNNYAYSITTQAHQRKLRALLDYLNIKIDVEVETGCSLIGLEWEPHCIDSAKCQIIHLKGKQKTGRVGSQAWENRAMKIIEYRLMIKNIKELMKLKD